MHFKDIPIFSELSQHDHELLDKIAIYNTCPRNTRLADMEHTLTYFFVLVSGRAKVSIAKHQQDEITLDILQEGDYFGDKAFLEEEHIRVNITALSECGYYSISHTAFQNLLASEPQFSSNFYRMLSRSMQHSNRQNEALLQAKIQENVIRALHELARVHDNEFVISYRITHRDIAAIVGTSREMVTRILMQLKETGIIELNNKGMTLVPLIYL